MTRRTLRTVLAAVAIGTLIGWAIPVRAADDLDKIRSKPALGQMSSQYLVPVQSPGESFARQIGFDKATRDILNSGPTVWRARLGEYALPTTCHVPPATGGTDVGTEACPFRSLWATEINGGTIPTGALGDVVGPAASTDHALARFDLTTGKLLQNSTAILTDAGALTGLSSAVLVGSSTGTARLAEITGSPAYFGLGLTGGTAATTYNIMSSPGDKRLFFNVPTGEEFLWRFNNGDEMELSATSLRPTNAAGLALGTAATGWHSLFLDDASGDTAQIITPTLSSDIVLTTPATTGTLALTSDIPTVDAAAIRALGFFDTTNDGTGSGLDADLLDGNHASAFSAAFTDSAGLRGLLSDESGTGAALFANGNIGAATGTSLALGAALSADTRRIYSSDPANTTTVAGFNINARIDTTLDPAGTSAATDYGIWLRLRTASGNAQNFTGARAAQKVYGQHLGNGSMASLQGQHIVVSVGPEGGNASSGTGYSDGLAGQLIDTLANSTSTHTATGNNSGQIISAGNASPGTWPGVWGQQVDITSINGGSGAGTITRAAGTVYGRNASTALTAGTITDISWLDLRDFPAGPTYTNPPVAIKIASLTPSNAVAIQTGTGRLDFGDTITTYDGIATVSKGVPSIIAEASGTAQGAAVGTTTLYTPTADGFYRVASYLQVTTAATSSSTLGGLTIGYTEADGSVAQTLLVPGTGTGGVFVTANAGNTTTSKLQGSVVVYAKSGVPITYAIAYASSGATPMQYAYRIKLESL